MLISVVDIYSCIFFLSFFLSNFTSDKCEAIFGICHKEATCNNTHGSYVCICKPGFIGDGHNCTGNRQ